MACCLCAKSMSRLNWRGYDGYVRRQHNQGMQWGKREKHRSERLEISGCVRLTKKITFKESGLSCVWVKCSVPTFTRRQLMYTLPMACYTPTNKHRIGNEHKNATPPRTGELSYHWCSGAIEAANNSSPRPICISVFFPGWAHNLPSDALQPTARPQWNGLKKGPWKHTKQKRNYKHSGVGCWYWVCS